MPNALHTRTTYIVSQTMSQTIRLRIDVQSAPEIPYKAKLSELEYNAISDQYKAISVLIVVQCVS